MLKGFKTKLDPNNEQRTAFAKHAGTARWAYNWGLSICHQSIEERRLAAEKGLPKPKFPEGYLRQMWTALLGNLSVPTRNRCAEGCPHLSRVVVTLQRLTCTRN